MQSIACLATIEAKVDEDGLLQVCERNAWPLQVFSVEEVNRVPNLPNPSAWAQRALGARGVAEPSAALAAHTNKWLVEKQRFANVTVAVCLREHPASRPSQRRMPVPGSISVIGIGPGSLDLMGPGRAPSHRAV